MRSRSCLARNLETISGPKVKDTPLSFSPQPIVSLSGSAQSRSHSKPGHERERGGGGGGGGGVHSQQAYQILYAHDF